MTELQITIKKINHQTTWPIRQQVMWPEKPLDYVKLDHDPEGIHFGLEVNGKLVSIVSAFISGKEAQFRKFATLLEEQGKGYGSQLLKHLLAELNALGSTKIWCNARADKTSYYERFGLQMTDRTFSKGGLAYIIMEKNLPDDS